MGGDLAKETELKTLMVSQKLQNISKEGEKSTVSYMLTDQESKVKNAHRV